MDTRKKEVIFYEQGISFHAQEEDEEGEEEEYRDDLHLKQEPPPRHPLRAPRS